MHDDERAQARMANPPELYDPSANGHSHVAEMAAGARLVVVADQSGETADGQLWPVRLYLCRVRRWMPMFARNRSSGLATRLIVKARRNKPVKQQFHGLKGDAF